MAAPEGNPTTPIDPRQTVVSSPPSQATGDQPTIDLRDHTVDLRDTILVPAQGGPPVPAPAPVEILRFGPGVPAVLAAAPVLAATDAPQPRRLRRERAFQLALTLTLAAVVVWLLWPAGALRVRTLSVKATPTLVACDSSADVVATVATNGNAGTLTYRWTRNDGVGSAALVQSLARGQHTVNLRLTWTFHGPGSFDARATVQLLSPGKPRAATPSASVNFSYVC